MRKFVSTILAIVVWVTANVTAIANDKQRYPQVQLTLNDSTVYHGYLCCDLHDTGNKISVSETSDGEKVSHKIADIRSLVVIYPDGQNETYIPIRVWDRYSKKIGKDPILATTCFSGKHVVGYRVPDVYIKSSAADPSSNFQSYTWESKAWLFYYKSDDGNGLIKFSRIHIPAKKAAGSKSILKEARKNFKEYPFVQKP